MTTSTPSLEENIVTPLVVNDVDYGDKANWVVALREIKKILDEAGVRYWLDTGTLLGAVRSGKFIPRDDDIDLSALFSEIPRILALTPQFHQLGYRVDVTDSSIYLSGKDKPKIGLSFYRIWEDKIWVLFLIKYTRFDKWLRHLRRVANKIIYIDHSYGLPAVEYWSYRVLPQWLRWTVRRVCFGICDVLRERSFAIVLPKFCIESLGTIKLYDMEFNIPQSVETYLATLYGDDWRIPRTSWCWEDTNAIDYEFVPFKRRMEYSLFSNKMAPGYLEPIIIQRFDQVGDSQVEAKVDDSNFEWRALVNEVKVFNPADTGILEVGSGKGKFVGKLNQIGFDAVGVEPSRNLLSEANKLYPEAKFILGSATALPIADNSFDIVICVETLEHIPDTNKAVSEMQRVLKPGGKLIIIDKNINSLHYLYFMPTAIWKWWRETTGQWMYPKKFLFREKYFVPRSFGKLLQQHFATADWQGLQFVPDQRQRSSLKLWYWRINQFIAGKLHRNLPTFDFYIIWRAVK